MSSVPSSSGAGGSGLKRSYCCIQKTSDDSMHDEAGGPSKAFMSKLVEMMNNPELNDEEIEDDDSSIDSSATNISNTSDSSNSTLN